MITIIFVVLFIVINIISIYYLSLDPVYSQYERFFIIRNSETGIELQKLAFDTDDEELLVQYNNTPGIRAHTVLHFTEAKSRPYYNIGIEGARYLPDWTDDLVKQFLSQRDGLTFVFGGSTTFGDGVPDHNTVVAYLNEIDAKEVYINFGVQAYDSIREVDKLIYLLRKGYRPETVIFIDGLNDVTTFARSPYEIHDTPRAQGLIIDRGQAPLIFGYPKGPNMLLALAYSFPVTHLMYRWQNKMLSDESTFIRKSANIHGIDDWFELMEFHYKWADIHVNKTDELADDILRYYQENIAFVQQLGQAFGFKAYFIYQPIGLLEEDQPFLKQEFMISNYFVVYEAIDSKIRMAIAEEKVSMKDCSHIISEAGIEGSYIDATHYSPRGNRVLAQCILQKIAEDNQIDP